MHGPPMPIVSSQLISHMQGGSVDEAVPEIASLLKMFPTQPQQGHLELPSGQKAGIPAGLCSWRGPGAEGFSLALMGLDEQGTCLSVCPEGGFS